MDERTSVGGTNAARDKPMSSDSSTQLEHAAWQDGTRTPIGTAHTRHMARWRRRRPFVGTTHAPASARPAPVRSTAQERKIYGVFQLAPHKVQYANPGLACTPDQAKSGCWAPQVDRRDERRRGPAAQGARTVRGPVAGLRMNLGTTCMLDSWPSRSQTDQAVPSLPFGAGLSDHPGGT